MESQMKYEDRVSGKNGAVGMSKVERYKWATRNMRGVLQYVSKHILQVDHLSYQRDLNDGKRKRIAANFNWAAFGVLVVARRADGSLWVIDGQHRLAAVLSRADILDVPVVIFDIDSVQDEAVDFLVTNKERKPLTGIETFKAMVRSGDAVAVEVKALVESHGRTIGAASSLTVACPHALLKSMSVDADAMKRVWPLIVTVSEGQHIDSRVVQGLFTLERRMVDTNGRPVSVALNSSNRAKIIEAGASALLRAINEASAYHRVGGETVWARGILNLLNHRRRHRLLLRGDQSGEAVVE